MFENALCLESLCRKFIFLLTAALISHIEQVLAHYINQIVYVPVLKVFLRVQWTIDLGIQGDSITE